MLMINRPLGLYGWRTGKKRKYILAPKGNRFAKWCIACNYSLTVRHSGCHSAKQLAKIMITVGEENNQQCFTIGRISIFFVESESYQLLAWRLPICRTWMIEWQLIWQKFAVEYHLTSRFWPCMAAMMQPSLWKMHTALLRGYPRVSW